MAREEEEEEEAPDFRRWISHTVTNFLTFFIAGCCGCCGEEVVIPVGCVCGDDDGDDDDAC